MFCGNNIIKCNLYEEKKNLKMPSMFTKFSSFIQILYSIVFIVRFINVPLM